MQMKYVLVNEFDQEKNQKRYDIRETQTESVIKSFFKFDEARKFMRHLNKNGGFDGWTPTFVLTDFSKYLKFD